MTNCIVSLYHADILLSPFYLFSRLLFVLSVLVLFNVLAKPNGKYKPPLVKKK